MHPDQGILIDLPRLPPGVTRRALKQFVRSGLSDAGFRGLALARAIPDCSIIRITNTATGRTRLQGLVRIRPAKAAMLALTALQGRELLGEAVHLRRHIHRTVFADDGAGQPGGAKRRRDAFRIELVDP
jgi:hypothetical protein